MMMDVIETYLVAYFTYFALFVDTEYGTNGCTKLELE